MDRSKEKEVLRAQSLKRLAEEQKLLQSYLASGRLNFAKLPILEPHMRNTFLNWLSKALDRKDWRAKTEDGRYYRVEEETPGAVCILTCTDGELQIPAYSLIFEEELL